MSPTPDPQPEQTPQAERDQYLDRDAAARDAEADRSRLATDPDPTLTGDEQAAGKPHASVEWVRPTDLAVRGAGNVLGRGVELNEHLRDAVQEAARTQRDKLQQRLHARDAELEPAVQERTRVPAPGREGVSR